MADTLISKEKLIHDLNLPRRERRCGMTDSYKPLTPKFRSEINMSIDSQVNELNTCRSNGYVSAQRVGLLSLKALINALPDGYPLPMKKGGAE